MISPLVTDSSLPFAFGPKNVRNWRIALLYRLIVPSAFAPFLESNHSWNHSFTVGSEIPFPDIFFIVVLMIDLNCASLGLPFEIAS